MSDQTFMDHCLSFTGGKMPIYKRGSEKIHFVHIPKTGGMSIRDMLDKSGWHNLYDDQKGDLFLGDNKPYHGHMPYSYWKDWSKISECSFEFAIVRNPVERVNSMINMYLRSIFKEKEEHAWKNGGFGTPELESFLVEMGLMPPETDTQSDVINAVYNIYLPRTDADLHEVARQNNVTPHEYALGIQKNRNHLMDKVTDHYLDQHFGKTLTQISWIEFLTHWFEKTDANNAERHGICPCPANKYLGPNTHVYRFENLHYAREDLVSRGIVDDNVDILLYNNQPKVSIQKMSSWIDNPATRDLFYRLYDLDFEKLGYDLNTKFPGEAV